MGGRPGLQAFVLPADLAAQYATTLATTATTDLDGPSWRVRSSLYPKRLHLTSTGAVPTPAQLELMVATAWAATH